MYTELYIYIPILSAIPTHTQGQQQSNSNIYEIITYNTNLFYYLKCLLWKWRSHLLFPHAVVHLLLKTNIFLLGPIELRVTNKSGSMHHHIIQQRLYRCHFYQATTIVCMPFATVSSIHNIFRCMTFIAFFFFPFGVPSLVGCPSLWFFLTYLH